MGVTRFPDPRSAPPDGLLALGEDLSPERLLEAYRKGIFPWPVHYEGDEITAWFSPDPRAILDLDELHLPRSLEKTRRKQPYRLTVDTALARVIEGCASVPRPGQRGTWITPAMRHAYLELGRLGIAHSVEAWDGETLAGGIYGVDIDGAFAGESMFHLRPNASKLALLRLIEILREGGLGWMDIQMLTPHLEALGAREISRDDFLRRLSRTRACGLRPWGAA